MKRRKAGLLPREVRVLRACAAYVVKHYAEPLTIEALSMRFLLHRKKLTSGFKIVHGQTIRQLLIQTRMQKAKEILLTTEVPIKALPVLVGYSERNFFHRFQLHFGCSPEDIRADALVCYAKR